MVGDLTQLVNELLARAGERFRLSPRKVGAVLTSLGFIYRKRTNCGWTVWLDRSQRERVHQLVKAYGMERIKLVLPVSPEKCSLCEAAHVHGQAAERKETKVPLIKVENNMGFWGRVANQR